MCLYVYVRVMCVCGCLWGVAGVSMGVVDVSGCVLVGVYPCLVVVYMCGASVDIGQRKASGALPSLCLIPLRLSLLLN